MKLRKILIVLILLVLVAIGYILLNFSRDFVNLSYEEAINKAEVENLQISFVSQESNSDFATIFKEDKNGDNYTLYISTGNNENINKDNFENILENAEKIGFDIKETSPEFSLDVKKDSLLNYDVDFNNKQLAYQFSLGDETIKTRISLAAVGDILIHDTVYQDARTNKGYDFKPMFKNIKKQFKGYDLIYANQESLTGGSSLGLTSYPTFNSPTQIIDALDDLGVNLISRANNHTLDKGEAGVIAASKYFDKFKHITTAGAQRSFKEQDQIRIVDVKGVKVSFLNYTYGFNGIPLPEGKEYLGNLFSYEKAEKDIKKAREQSDVVIVAMHWGVEYAPLPNDEQRKQAKFLNEQKVDIILGGHPHVLEPVDFIKKDNHETFIIYSLGNFLSAQAELEQLTGMILSLDIDVEKSINGTKVSVKNVKGLPTYNYPQSGLSNYTIRPLSDSPQASYFNQVKELMTTYTDRIKIVKTLQE